LGEGRWLRYDGPDLLQFSEWRNPVDHDNVNGCVDCGRVRLRFASGTWTPFPCRSGVPELEVMSKRPPPGRS
jgi:hypothetical protein